MRLRTLLETADLGLTLLVGAEALDRTVSRVLTATLRDPSRYLTGGELVLSGMEWWRGPDDSDGFVSALAAAGVTALVAGTAEAGGGPVPDHVVAACRRHGVPLLSVSVDVSFATVSEWVILALASARGVDRHRRLVAAVTSGGGLADLVAAGAAELDASCWVLTAAGRVLAGPALPADLRTAVVRRVLRADRLPIVVSRHSVFFSRGWYLVVDGDHRHWDVDQQAVAAEFATLVGLERSRLDEARRIESRAAVPLLRVLLSEDATQADITSRLAATDLTPPVVVLSAGGASLAVVKDLLAAFPGPAFTAEVGGEVHGLIGIPDPAAVVGEIKETLRILSPEISLGMSQCADETSLRTAMQEARHARKLAELSAARTAVVVGDEVASHLLLLAAVPDELRRSFRARVLGPLIAYDHAHKSELLRTLRVFLEHSGSWAQTAAALHVHVNTLRYRISRISELTGRDLTRFPDRVDLYLALDHS
ncbi:PucR family transcriptional regulator [Actinocrispum wychmicini]|uniref:Purine catabolism regulatory family protein n=1 Tax=Actinocrispum wychmicini TaxID=1213861 RepID=A0A4R2J6E7_9PSEU|nr:PucR family transcriptional regulator [Actinocrispum wychmicini]TCO53617.1 purine catabolism regulatory family protein [Actinocrispum wychmicini]